MEFNVNCNEVISIVKNLFTNAQLGFKGVYKSSEEWDCFEDYCYDHEIQLCSGLSKFVIVPSNTDYVIKIPFKGSYYHWDKEYSDIADHCDLEVKCYNDYANSELGYLFVPTQYVGCIDEIKIYVQPKVETYHYETHSASKHSYDQLEDFDYYECTADDEDAVAAFIEEFGENAAWVLDTLDEMEVKDIHCGNFGYLNGKLVLFDYCGYHHL